MSQSEQAGGTASESVQQSAPTKVVINSDDIAWAHCYCPDPKKKYSIVCNYYKKMINGGITRVKFHLARLGGHNVSKCDKVPTDVKQEMLALVAKKNSEKEQKQMEKKRARDVIDLDHSDGEMCTEEDSDYRNEVIVLKSTKGPSGSAIGSSSSGSMEKFYKPISIEEAVQKNQKGASLSQKVQATLTTQKREERRDRACEYDNVFVKFNSRLSLRRENKSRDPLEKKINDVLEDYDNEFITGIEPETNQSEEDQGCAETAVRAQEGASGSQAKPKRKRPVRQRKKIRTVASLMQPQSAALTSESEENQDAMVSISSDNEDD